MDISAIKNPIDFSGSVNLTKTNPDVQPNLNISAPKIDDVADKSLTALTESRDKKETPADLKKVTQMTEALNKFFHAMDANIRFKVHEKTDQLMVQIIDQANDKVLKEFPSGEFLDTLASIRDYVGILLDKKI